MNPRDKKLLDDAIAQCFQLSEGTATVDSTDEERAERIHRAKTDYRFFVQYYFPNYAKTPCAPWQIEAAEAVAADPSYRGTHLWFRGAAKSIHLGLLTPMWLVARGELDTMLLIGRNAEESAKLIKTLRDEMQHNERYIADFGTKYNPNDWKDNAFITRDDIAFYSYSLGKPPRGVRNRHKRPNYILVDDIDHDSWVNNDKMSERYFRYIMGSVFGTMHMGRGRFVVVGNVIHPRSVLKRISELEHFRCQQINLLTDEGESAWPENITTEAAVELLNSLPHREAQTEYMNNPVLDGGCLQREWIKWEEPLPLKEYDALLVYSDPSYRPSKIADYKAVSLWGRKGKKFHKLRCFLRQATVQAWVRWIYDLYLSLPEDVRDKVLWRMEGNFQQSILLQHFDFEALERGFRVPMGSDLRSKPKKERRIEQSFGYWEAGRVAYSLTQKDDPDMLRSIDQALAFNPNATRQVDDGPDCDEGALWLLKDSGGADVIRVGQRRSSSSYRVI